MSTAVHEASAHSDHDEHQNGASEHADQESGAMDRINYHESSIRAAMRRNLRRIGEEPLSCAIRPMPPVELPWQPIPKDGLPTLKKGLATAAFLAAPPLTVAAAGGYFAWKAAKKYPPFSWVDRGVRAATSTAIDGAKSLVEVVTYPARAVVSKGVDAANYVGRAGYKLFDLTVLDTWRGFRKLIDRNDGDGVEDVEEGEKEPNIPSRLLYGSANAAWAIVKSPFKLAANILEQIPKHPIPYTVGTLLLLGALNTAGWNPVVVGTNFLTLAKHLGSAALTKLGIPLP